MRGRIGSEPHAVGRDHAVLIGLVVDGFRRGSDPVMPFQPARRQRQVERRHRTVEEHHRRSHRPFGGHRPIAPGLSAQPARQLVYVLFDQHRIRELEHLPPVRIAEPDRRDVGAAQDTVQTRRRHRPLRQPHAQGRPPVDQAGPRPAQRAFGDTDPGRRADHLIERIAVLRGRGIDRHRPRPRVRRHGKARQMRRLVPGQKRQVEEHGIDRHGRCELRQLDLALDPVRGRQHARFDPHRLNHLDARLLDMVDAEIPGAVCGFQFDHVARPPAQVGRGQREPRPVPRHPRLGQPPLGDPPRLGLRQDHRQVRGRDGMRLFVRENRLDRPHLIGGLGFRVIEPHPPHHLGLGGAGELQIALDLVGRHEPCRVERAVRRALTREEIQHPLALRRLEPVGQHERLKRRARVGHLIDHVAAHQTVKPRDVEMRDAGARADLGHDRGERAVRRPPVQPMAPFVILPIPPGGPFFREPRERARIPGPDMGAVHVDHLDPRKLVHGIVRGVFPELAHRPQVLHLHEIVAVAVGITRQRAFRAFRVQKLVRLVRALVDGRAAVFGEPDRFRSRHPVCRRGLAHAADPVVMLVLPPAPDVLVTPHPRLIVRPVGDRGAKLHLARFGRVVVPVVPLAPHHVRFQVVEIVDRTPMRVRMILALAPVGHGHVVVDADEVDVRIGPERIEVKEHVARPVLRVKAEVFRPVGGIADLDAWAKDQADIIRQRLQLLDHRKAVPCPPDLGEAT